LKGGEKLNQIIALNQYKFQQQAEPKKSRKLSHENYSQSSFAEKMKAVQKRDDNFAFKEKSKEIKSSSDSERLSNKAVGSEKDLSKKNESSSGKDIRKMLQETAEEAFTQLAQLNLGDVDWQKLNSQFKEAEFLEAAGGDLLSKADGFELEFSQLSTANLKPLISDLENMISSSGVNLANNDQLASLLNLPKEVETEKNILSDNQAFGEKFADYFKFQNQAEPKTDELASLENREQIQISEKTAAAEIAGKTEKKNVDFTNSDQNKLSQKIDFEQRNLADNTLRQESAEKNTTHNNSKVEQESKLFNLTEQKEVSEFNSKVVLETAKGDNAAEKKIIDFNFSGADSSLNTELNAGDKTNSFALNNNQLKGELPVKDQFVQQFKGEFSAAKNEMNIELKPESLGKIEVRLNLNEGKIDARMLVENKLVQTQLESSMKEIKSDLIKQGINIEQFKIETAKAGPRQVEQQNDFNLNDQNSAFSDGETGQNQEYEQRQFFQGQYYVERGLRNSSLDRENIVMRQQEIINRAAFSKGKLNLIV
jgi:flagellar hook-length control protein FliK